MVELKLIISSFVNFVLCILCFVYKEFIFEEVVGLIFERIKENGLFEGDFMCIVIVGIKDFCRFGVFEVVVRC